MEEGGAELCEGTIERVGSDGRTAVGGGGGAAILSPCSGGGAGRCWSVLPLHWLPSPTLPEEPEQCWQICLHVFIIIKNMKDPSSLKAQQITFSLSPPSAELLYSLSFSSTLPRSPTPPRPVRLGDPSLLRAQCSLGVSNDGWEFQGSAGRKQLSEGRPMPQGGSCTPASSGERKSLGNKEKTLSTANEGRSRCSCCLQYLAFLLFLTLLLSTVGVLRGETSLEWKKPGVFSVRAHRPPGPRLVKSLSAQESRIECILVACVLCY